MNVVSEQHMRKNQEHMHNKIIPGHLSPGSICEIIFDVAAQHMRKNQYEEALFRCEDDRFELDMVIESNASAVRAITPLVQQLSELPPDEKATWRPPPNSLTPIHYRAIQKIYGKPLSSLVLQECNSKFCSLLPSRL